MASSGGAAAGGTAPPASGSAPSAATAAANAAAYAAETRHFGPLWKAIGEPTVVGRAIRDQDGREGVVWLSASTTAAAPGARAPADSMAQPWRADIFWVAWHDGPNKWTYECPDTFEAGTGREPASSAVGVLCAGLGTSAKEWRGANTTIVRVAKPGLPFHVLQHMLRPRFVDHPFATPDLSRVLIAAQERKWQPSAGGGGGANGNGGGFAAAAGAILTSPARAAGRIISVLTGGAASGGGHGAAAGAGAGAGQETTSPELGRKKAPPPLALQRGAKAGAGGSGGKGSVKAPKTAGGRATRGSDKKKAAAAAAAAKGGKKPAAASKKRPAEAEAGEDDEEEEEQADETEDVQPTEQISADPEATRTDSDEDEDDADDRGTEDEAVVPSPTSRAHAGHRAAAHKRAKVGDAAHARVHPKFSNVKSGKGTKPVHFREEYPDRVTGKKWPPHLCRTNGDRAADEYTKAKFAADAAFEIERIIATRAMRQRRPCGTPSKTPTRYVLVKWKGFELDAGDPDMQVGGNGGWERLEALRQGGGKEAADEAWEEFDRGGGREEALEGAEDLGKGPLLESRVAWLQAAGPAGKGGKKK